MLARRPLPLLQDGQDPDGLAARVAYHLHRLEISIDDLNAAGISFDMARQMRRGDIQISEDFASEIARSLRLSHEDLSRALNDTEREEWTFYRTSARHATVVWKRVFETATALGYSQRDLGKLLDIPQSRLSLIASGRASTPALTLEHAKALAAAMGIEGREVIFIDGLGERVEREA